MPFMRLSLGSMLFASTLVLCNPTAWSAVSGADIYKEVLEGTAIYDDPKLDACSTRPISMPLPLETTISTLIGAY